MKPYGRYKKVRYPGKTDCHPRKGYANWWEDMCKCLPRKTIKRIWMKEVEKEA